MHIDDFIDDYGPDNNAYARWLFNHWRLPAALKHDFDQFMKDHKLFCSYKGRRYRVTGASRLGDVWLVTDFNEEHGHDLRVDVEKCTDWGPKP